MATAVLRSHDVLDNWIHQEAYGAASLGSKPRRRRQSKMASAALSSSSSPPKMYAVLSQAAPKRVASSSAANKPAAPKMAAVSSLPSKQAVLASSIPKGVSAGRRSPSARKQPFPTKEVRILKPGEETSPPAPAPSSAPVRVPAVAQAAPKDRRVFSNTSSRIAHHERSVVPAKTTTVSASAATYAGPAFSGAAPEPSSLPFPAFFFRQAEDEATRGLRCLLRIGELS